MVYGQHLVRLRLMLMAGVGPGWTCGCCEMLRLLRHLLTYCGGPPPAQSFRQKHNRQVLLQRGCDSHKSTLHVLDTLPAAPSCSDTGPSALYQVLPYTSFQKEQAAEVVLASASARSARTLNSQHDNDNDLLPPPSPLQPPHSYLSNYYSTIFIKTRP